MKHVVFLHGATVHPPGYSDAWWESLLPYVGLEVQKHEVLYGDIMSPLVPLWYVRARIAFLRWVNGYGPWVTPYGNEILDDFPRWMFVRDAVLNRLDETLAPLAGQDVTVICHSFGTVVMPEYLWWRETTVPGYQLKNLIMWGGWPGAAPVLMIQYAGKPSGWNAHRPTNVERVCNFGMAGDWFSGLLPGPELWERQLGDLEQLGIQVVSTIDKEPARHADSFNPSNRYTQQLMAGVILQ